MHGSNQHKPQLPQPQIVIIGLIVKALRHAKTSVLRYSSSQSFLVCAGLIKNTSADGQQVERCFFWLQRARSGAASAGAAATLKASEQASAMGSEQPMTAVDAGAVLQNLVQAASCRAILREPASSGPLPLLQISGSLSLAILTLR